MKKLISLMLALLLLAGLAGSALAEDAQAVDYTTGTPWLCIDLEGTVTEDTPTDPKDDFALYANKDAILSLEIPEGYPFAGALMDLVLQQAEDVKNMFLGDAPEGHDALLAYHLFQLMMDWDSRNALGVAPLKEDVDRLEGIDSLDALTAYFLEVPVEDQAGSLWSIGSITDAQDSSRYILAVANCSLLLDDSAEYSTLTDFGAIKKEAATELAQKMLVKLGYPEVEALQKIENCFAFESMFAPSVYTNEEQLSADYHSRIYNLYTRDQLAEAQGKLPVLGQLEKIGFPEAETYQVVCPDFLVRMNELWTEENLPLIRDYMIVHHVISSASRLDRECYEWAYARSNAVTGVSGMLDDETMFSSLAAEKLEWPVAQLYSEKYLKQEDKERITELVEEMIDVYHSILENADFLSDATKAKAIEKLEAMKIRVLYPDSWERYNCEGLEIASPEAGGSLWQAYRSIDRYTWAKMVKDYSNPVDKEKWPMTPQTVNCCHYFYDNSINILGAYAQGEMYNSSMSEEELLATLGTGIGHEISHGFDRTGAQFDKTGNMASWWAEEDYAKFVERNEKLAAYFDAMHPWEGQNFYGSIMTGEACADMAGMKAALLIAAEKEDFDYDAFFRAFARSKLTKGTLQAAYMSINDVHPMDYLRINYTLQQFDEFLNCYGIEPGDGMYLAPEDRVAVW